MENDPVSCPDSTVRTLRRLLPVGGMATVATCLPPLGAAVVLGTMPVVGPWLREQEALGLMVYIAGFVVLAGLALLPTFSQAMLGGWAFGFGWGLAAAMVGFIGAGMLGYGIASRLAGEHVIATIERRPSWRAVHRAMTRAGVGRATLMVVLVRLPPSSPFALTNVVLASAKMPWLPYLLGTALGLLPRTAAAVLAAASLARLDGDHPAAIDSPWYVVLTIAATAAVLIALGLIARRALRRLTKRSDPQSARTEPPAS